MDNQTGPTKAGPKVVRNSVSVFEMESSFENRAKNYYRATNYIESHNLERGEENQYKCQIVMLCPSRHADLHRIEDIASMQGLYGEISGLCRALNIGQE